MRAALCLPILLLLACTDPGRPSHTANGCTYASDCSSGEVCLDGDCVPQVKADPCDGVICSSGQWCDPTEGRCVARCGQLDACPAATPHCDLVFEACRECIEDSHCATGWTCDRGACVDARAECTHDGACRPPETVCSNQQCVPGCNVPGTPIICRGSLACDPATGQCAPTAGCRADADCAPPSTVCAVDGSCVTGCLSSGCPAQFTCSGGTGRCEPENVGSGCTTDADCAAPTTICVDAMCTPGCATEGGLPCGQLEICEASTGRCEPSPACMTESDCPAAAPLCGPQARCIPGCDQNGGFCLSGQVCNTSTGRCEDSACSADAHCFAPTPLCDVTSGSCYGCTADADCTAPTPLCDVASGACYGCQSNADCGGTTPVCNQTIGVCVGCATSADCPSGTPVCDPASASCRGCTGNAECGGSTPACHTPSGVCVGCVSNAECGGSTPVCDGSTGSCRGCASSVECSGNAPICHVPSGLCLECVTNADCAAPTPTCNGTTGQCEACTPGFCGGGQICNTQNGLCETPPAQLGDPCGVDSDCISDVCLDFGNGGRCTASCNDGGDCNNNTSCHMFSGARVCINPNSAPGQAEEISCTTNRDCSINYCYWVEESSGRWDQRCGFGLGNGGDQASCFSGNDCRSGVCTQGIQNPNAGFCRRLCAKDSHCQQGFACMYLQYSGASYTQAVKACIPVAPYNPAICGTDGDCPSGQRCKVINAGCSGPTCLANACLPGS